MYHKVFIIANSFVGCLTFILLTREGSHREVSTRNSNPVMTSSTGGTKGCSDHRFRAPPTYTAQLLTLHQHRANNHYRMANQIKPTLRLAAALRQHLNSPTLVSQGGSPNIYWKLCFPRGIERVSKIVMCIDTKLCYCLQKLQTS